MAPCIWWCFFFNDVQLWAQKWLPFVWWTLNPFHHNGRIYPSHLYLCRGRSWQFLQFGQQCSCTMLRPCYYHLVVLWMATAQFELLTFSSVFCQGGKLYSPYAQPPLPPYPLTKPWGLGSVRVCWAHLYWCQVQLPWGLVGARKRFGNWRCAFLIYEGTGVDNSRCV